MQNILTLWAYAQWPKKWPFERTLKEPKNDPLSVRSETQKMTLWAYAQGHIFVVPFHMGPTYHLCLSFHLYQWASHPCQLCFSFAFFSFLLFDSETRLGQLSQTIQCPSPRPLSPEFKSFKKSLIINDGKVDQRLIFFEGSTIEG